jgi:hypothetical protein
MPGSEIARTKGRDMALKENREVDRDMFARKPGVLVFDPPDSPGPRPFQPMPRPKAKPAEPDSSSPVDPKAATLADLGA